MSLDSEELFVTPQSFDSADQKLQPRLIELRNFFNEQFGHQPEFFVKVPGRVNIIGEHVDYCGYPVLPMALEQCIIIAVSANTSSILSLRNCNSKYKYCKRDLKSFSIDVPASGGPDWYNYFLCGVKGILDQLNNAVPIPGMSVAISGNVPPASGLSSSSALVSSAVLATAYLLKVSLNRRNLASISASCERFIGTEGGGMDQAIAYLAKKGFAQFIEFHPELNASSVRLPSNAYFVVANSLAENNKAATSDFNERVVECRLGCRLLAKKLNINNWKEMIRFVVLQEAIACDLLELEQLTLQGLDKDIYTRNDIIQELDITDVQLIKDFLTPNTKDMQFFKLQQRALHVIQESLRVQKFRAISESGNASIDELSKLMQASHNSLRYLYECSHPSLDTLVELSDRLGVGARLTGAGWGGSIVALCSSRESSEKFINELKEKYYKNLPQAKGYDLDDVVFATCSQNGAQIFYSKEN